MNISERLSALRDVMRHEGLDAFIFPSTDPHNGEYVPEHWKAREFISGFSGSAGTAVVTMNDAALWTDSRYFIAADEQLKDTEYVLMKDRLPGTPSIVEWLGMKLAHLNGAVVGVDGMVNMANDVERLITDLRHQGGITVRSNYDPLKIIWNNRPEIPLNPVEIYPLEYAGVATTEKIMQVRACLKACHTDGILVAALDDIAWLLNLRGSDIHCNPVFVSYLLIEADKVTLFINSVKVDKDVADYLTSCDIDLAEYNEVKSYLKHYDGYSIMLDSNAINYSLFNSVSCHEIINQISPIPAMKAIKNECEIEGFHRAMIRDGVAMVKFLKWLKPAVLSGKETELSIDRKLTSLRAEQLLFKSLSFDTIAGYQEHGAVIHYETDEKTDAVLKPKGFLLLDSGAQYLDGTTDITRTIALGEITEEQKLVYTLVLKGHIAIELCKFPTGISGTQIDILARKDMWQYGYHYLHGTGHGVGAYLNVHEGPHQIRMNWMPAPLMANMTVTDEPGIYLEGKFGCRIENTLLVVPYQNINNIEFLQFEALTLCPIDTTPIILDLLTDEEIDWLNNYHQMVCDKLSPYLNEDELLWIKDATKPLNKRI